jgi:FkbM family methyltransferase
LNTVLTIIRRLATTPGFARLTHVGPLLRVSFALRGVLVRNPVRFALNELRGEGTRGVYELRAAPVRIALRHATPDVLVLDEIFSQREYELPRQVREALASCPRPRIVDLGANVGLFGAFVFGEYPEAEIVAVEADPENAAVHERTIAANPDRSWYLIPAYAGTANGTVRFESGGFSGSHASRDGVGIEVQAIDAFDYLAQADLVKIDIEGGEWALLGDARFRSLGARAVVVEYHADSCPSSNPARQAEQALGRAGFAVIPGPEKPQFRAGLLWGARS